MRLKGREGQIGHGGQIKPEQAIRKGEEEECESDFANVESELLWRYSSDVS